MDEALVARLVISVLPSVAKLWLSPRLQRLHQALPELTVEVRTRRELANLETDGVDIAMRFGLGGWPRLHVEPLFDEVAYVVASPDFAAPRAGRSPTPRSRRCR